MFLLRSAAGGGAAAGKSYNYGRGRSREDVYQLITVLYYNIL